MSIRKNFNEYWLHFIFLISLSGMLGSLYMSEIEKFIPCPFCWWQRVWLYPIVIISSIGILSKNKATKYNILALSIIGTIFSLYQNLLQLGIFKESEECTVNGTSCATPTIFIQTELVSISLEFAALSAFLLINLIVALRIFIFKD